MAFGATGEKEVVADGKEGGGMPNGVEGQKRNESGRESRHDMGERMGRGLMDLARGWNFNFLKGVYLFISFNFSTLISGKLDLTAFLRRMLESHISTN